MIKPKIKIFLVDDHPLVREWLTNLIRQQPDLAVCGEAEDAPHALREIAAAKPDVAIVDISLKQGSGIELIKDLKALDPNLAVLVLSMHDEQLYAERALRAGARGYIMKRETAKKIILAIRQMLGGKIYMATACRRPSRKSSWTASCSPAGRWWTSSPTASWKCFSFWARAAKRARSPR